jgi:hypothetical protein
MLNAACHLSEAVRPFPEKVSSIGLTISSGKMSYFMAKGDFLGWADMEMRKSPATKRDLEVALRINCRHEQSAPASTG